MFRRPTTPAPPIEIIKKRNAHTSDVQKSGVLVAATAVVLAGLVALLSGPAGSAGRVASAPVSHPTTSHAAPTPSLSKRNSEQPLLRGMQEQPSSDQAASTISASTISGSAVAAAPTPDGRGFWVAWSNGAVTAEGDAHWYGDAAGVRLSRPLVGIAATPSGKGYWLLGGDGGVFSFGDAGFHGSTGNVALRAPALQMVSTHDGRGYDFVAGDGGIFSFGDARFFGSTGNIALAKPVVGMAATRDGRGYWLVASDGGIFAFGDAGFHGSTGGLQLAQPVVGMARTPSGAGYWLLAADGGIFTFGNAGYHGSGAGQTAGSPAIGVVATGDGGGYWIVLADGRVLAKGDAHPMSGPTTAAGPPPPNGNYTFEVTSGSGVPARWNPCEAVHYAVIVPGAPSGWQGDVSNAIAQVQAATGLSLVNAGAYNSAAQVPASAKLVISWVPALSSGDMVGLTTYWYYNTAGYTPQIVSAQVQLLSSLRGGGGSGELPVLLHELGHAMGLGHTAGATEVMNPIDLNLSGYQLGDRNGLWRLGANGGCAGFYQ